MSFGYALVRRLANYDDPESFASRLRARRVAPLLRLIESASARQRPVDVIDLGGTERYWNILPPSFLDDHDVKITILNRPGTGMPADHGRFRFLEGDACRLPGIADRAFHIAHSNSVLEHVGDWTRMVQFAAEVNRVADRSFVQTPNYWCPLEPHYMAPVVHWLPKPWLVWLLQRMQLGSFDRALSVDHAVRIVESINLVNRTMLRELFRESRVHTEWVLGVPKSLIAIRE